MRVGHQEGNVHKFRQGEERKCVSQVVSFVGGSLPKSVHAQKQKACWSVKVTGQQAEEGAQATYREDATGTRGFTCGVRWLLPGFFRLLPCRPSRSR